MSSYHLFYLASERANIVDRASFQALDDEAAVALIEGGGFSIPLELWCGFERVRRFDRAGPAARAGRGVRPV